MRKVRPIWLSGCVFSFALLPLAFADDVIISEIMAANRSTLADQDGDYPDWVEIFNCRTEAVNLDGWHLTDDPEVRQKWAFPAVVVPSKGFLIVFASRKSISTAERQLHTNFRINNAGEFVGLVRPDDTFSFALPEFPRQIADASYGFAMETVSTEILASGATARYLVPMRSRDRPSAWNEADFDDSAWAEGVARFGFDRGEAPVLGELIETDVGELMHEENASLFMRIPLEIPDPLNTASMRLRVQYNDGFVAYINGVEVARRNATNTRYNSSANEERPIEETLVEESADLIIPAGTLREDRNVLAIQAMNLLASNTDFLFIPALDVVEVTSVAPEARYFAAPSPAAPNTAQPFEGISEPPVLTPGSRSFVGRSMITSETESAGAVIRYTVDGTRPDETSPVYEGPFEIDRLAVVQARSFEPGKLPSETVKETYLKVSQQLAEEFTSNIPVVLVSTFDSRISERLIARMHMQIIEGSDVARASLTNGQPHFAGDGAIKTRGSSTADREKASYGFEIQDGAGDDLDVSLLGMPDESDWILYGAYNFDRALVRNAFMYELSNQVGRYAVRTRFCEVFVHVGRSTTEIDQANYMGVYSLCEKIKQGPDRVDIEPLLPSDETEPEVTGGYVLKIDRRDLGDSGVTAAGQTILFVDPKERELTSAQKAWVRQYFDQMAVSLRDGRSQPVDDIFERAYTKFIDVDSWIDYHILNALPKNPDQFVLSSYFFKRRSGLVEFGPIWDYDRALGPDDDDRSVDPSGWGVHRAQHWWGMLLTDPVFLRRYSDRWIELRQAEMSTSNLHAIIDSMAADIQEAQVRNNERWGLVTSAGWETEIGQLKAWIEQRVEWIDAELISLPILSHPGGAVSAGLEVTMSSPDGLAVYFTLDGSDPRGADGPSANAVLFESPIVIEENTQLRLRAGGLGSSWSDLVEAFYVTSAPPLVVTEIMYNPPSFEDDAQNQTSNYEFLEFQNVGDEPLDLTGYKWQEPRLSGTRLRFDFSGGGVTTVMPGAFIVVSRHLEGFRERYGDDLAVFGEIDGNLQNSGETIRVIDADGFPVTEFKYDDDWDASTDGFGKSLVIRNPRAAPETWALRESWRASAEIGGSPGRVDPDPAGQLVADVNLDGRRSVTDAVSLLLVFSGKSEFPCATAEANDQLLDANRDGRIDVSDAVHLLDFLFRSGTASILGSNCVEIDGCRNACAN